MYKYGLKIWNIEAGSLFEYNNGARQSYRYTQAMLTNSLFFDYLIKIGLKSWREVFTKDVVGIDFQMGSRSFEEELAHLEKTKKKYIWLNKPEQVEKLQTLIDDAKAHPEKFVKKSKEEIREIFYRDGVTIEYVTKNKKGEVKKIEKIHYKMLFRSTGKAKKGSTIFIRDRFYAKALNFLRMGIKLPTHNAPIVEISAYSPLVASSIVGKVHINPENILIIKDIDSYFKTKVVSVETDEEKRCQLKTIEEYQVKNTMFDGQALIDERLFPSWGNGYILLRHHFCKMAAFCTNIQKFFKDYFGEQYDVAEVEDMFGNKHRAKDIELITTDNAMKWLKFDVSYEYWCDRVRENGCEFGIVKTAHKSKLGEVQRMSYQMVNTLNMDIMPNVVSKSVEYIDQLKTNDDVFLDYLKKNINFANDYDVLVALVEQNRDFIRSEFFRQRRKQIIYQYTLNFKSGHIVQNGDNLTICGSPYAMLLASVGEDVEKDKTLQPEEGLIQCYTERFNHEQQLAGFRSPHNSSNNIIALKNIWSCEMAKYFNLGTQTMALNVRHTDVQDRANGCDFDSDSFYVTDQPDIVAHAIQCYQNFPTIVNNIPKDKKKYDNTPECFAMMDNNLASAQRAIGESSNLAQIALTYSYNFTDQKLKDYVCILSVLAQVAIDNAKRRFDLDLVEEIKRIKKDMEMTENKYPCFWEVVKEDFNKSKLNYSLICPMNYLYNIKFKKYKDDQEPLPMSYFFQKFELDTHRRKCKKVEDLIQKYSLDVFNCNISEEEDKDKWLVLQEDFDNLIDDIHQLYLSNNYLGLMSWLIDRAFNITNYQEAKQRIGLTNSTTNKNKALLLKTLYNVNPQNLLKIFSKNAVFLHKV